MLNADGCLNRGPQWTVTATGAHADQFGYFAQQAGQVLGINRKFVPALDAPPAGRWVIRSYERRSGTILFDPGVGQNASAPFFGRVKTSIAQYKIVPVC